ncbi:MAG TPA: Hsp20/alpha crystallin family protein [Bryobacteraceae bacterium]|nr:Hsp20/alpha crystallin family protein [Bryobacteraceae bacterium]
MSLTQFDPLANFPATFRSFEDAVARMLNEPRGARPWSPSVDIAETEDELVLKADLPEVKLEDVEVRVENQTLTLKGERKFEQDNSVRGFHRIERSYGAFTRSFSVPGTVDSEKVTAELKNGVLTVKLPKKEAAKPRQVKIEVKG